MLKFDKITIFWLYWRKKVCRGPFPFTEKIVLKTKNYFKEDTLCISKVEMLQKLSKLNKLFVEHKLTKSFGADVFVFELVIGCIRVDHNPLYAVTAKLLLIKTKKTHSFNQKHNPAKQSAYRCTEYIRCLNTWTRLIKSKCILHQCSNTNWGNYIIQHPYMIMNLKQSCQKIIEICKGFP